MDNKDTYKEDDDYEDEDNLNKDKCISKKVKVKRLILVIFSPILLYLFMFYRNTTNTSFIIFFLSLIIFSNFPIIVTINNSKPIYYEDLFINSKALPKIEIEAETLEIFKKCYVGTIIFTNSIFTSILVQYWLFKTEKTRGIYEIIGITGGILQIFQIVNNYTGILILKIFKIYIKKKLSKVFNGDNLDY